MAQYVQIARDSAFEKLASKINMPISEHIMQPDTKDPTGFVVFIPTTCMLIREKRED